MHGATIQGGASRLASAVERRNRLMWRMIPPPHLGYALPDPEDVKFNDIQTDHDDTLEVQAAYRTSGPVFVAYERRRDLRFLMYSELKNLRHTLQHLAFHALRRQVEAHNAVIRPIDNGPDDRVYLVETGHRVAEAVRASCEGRPDCAELQAACKANLYAADIVIANFNHHTEKD